MPQHPVTSDETARLDGPVPAAPEAAPPAPPAPPSPPDAAPEAAQPAPGTAPDPASATAAESAAPAEVPAAEEGPVAAGPAAAPLSDDTRPVPRDRGPVPGDPAPATGEDTPPAPVQPAWDATADIRFAPGQAPGELAGDQPPPPPSGMRDTAPVLGPAPTHGTAPDTGHDRPHAAVHDTAAITDAPADDTAVIGGTAALQDTATIGGPPANVDTAAPEPLVPGFGAPAGDGPGGHDRGGDRPDGHDRGGPGGDGPGAGGPGSPAGAPRRPWWRRPAVLAPAAAVVVLGGAYGVDLLVAGDDVPRNTVVAGVDIGGLSPAEAARELGQVEERISAEHTLQVGEQSRPFLPAEAGIALDVDGTVDAASGQPLNPWTRLTSFFTEREIDPVLSGEAALTERVDALANEVDLVPVDAGIAIEGTTATVTPPAAGTALDREGAVEAITTALATADPAEPIELPVEEVPFAVTAEEAQRVLDEVVTPGLAAPVTVDSSDGTASVEVPVEAIAASLTFTPQDGQLAVGIDPARLAEAMGEDLTAFGEPAQDARFEVAGGAVQVVPSVDGTGIDPAALATSLVDVLPSPAPRQVVAELGPVPADLTTEEAQALGIREEISSFTTSTGNNASGTNIRVVAEEVDGALVLPGETFSLNTYTGPRGTAQGYVPANVISGGQLSTAVGGGISQFATTMFNAVFFAGLEDVYHKPHTFYISRYPAGREATVYEGQIDLQWRNDSDTGVFVDTQWVPAAGGGGSITVTFYGTKRFEIEAVEGPRTNYRAPRSLEKPDDGSCISQTGVQGFDVTVTRIFRDLQTGDEIRRETFSTSYAAEDSIRCVPVAPEPDPATTDPNAPPASGPAPAPGPAGRRPGGRRAA